MPELHRKIFFLEWGHLLIVLFCQHLLSNFTKMFCLIIVFIIRDIEYHKMYVRKRNCVYIWWFVSGWKLNVPLKNVWLIVGFLLLISTRECWLKEAQIFHKPFRSNVIRFNLNKSISFSSYDKLNFWLAYYIYSS